MRTAVACILLLIAAQPVLVLWLSRYRIAGKHE